PIHANVPQGPFPLELSVKKVRAVLEMHRVSFGSIEDLPPFLGRLHEDRYFAMDFWAVASAISGRRSGEPAGLQDRQMIDVIVLAVTGSAPTQVREYGRELNDAVSALGRLLASADLENPPTVPEDLPPALPPQPAPGVRRTPPPGASAPSFARTRSEHRQAEPARESAYRQAATFAAQRVDRAPEQGKRTPERAQQQASQRAPEPVQRYERVPAPQFRERAAERRPEIIPEVVTRARSFAAASRPQTEVMAEEKITPPAARPQRMTGATRLPEMQPIPQQIIENALERLEKNGQWVKTHLEHLENISGNVNRIENRLSELETRISLFLGSRSLSAAKQAPEHGAERSPEQVSPVPAYVPPQTPPEQTPFSTLFPRQTTPVQAPDSVPESRPASSSASGLRSAPRPVTRARTSSKSDYAVPLGNYSEAGKRGSPLWIASLLLVFLLGAGGFLVIEKLLGDGALGRIAHKLNLRRADESSAPAASAPQSAVLPGDTSSAASDGTQAQPDRDFSTTSADAGSETPAASATDSSEPARSVPADVMANSLLNSGEPPYPEMARTYRIEGPVVMEAIISKEGTVDHLHVVSGNRLLWDAAKEAASKYRYKPYVADGHPVKVATNIEIDFKLPPQ
ncbi:MAG: energy transducer TonB, partial [Acidobacteriaceae bacterium]|nr:energy transducer TonB [Acidobacteriaceae bacterium]